MIGHADIRSLHLCVRDCEEGGQSFLLLSSLILCETRYHRAETGVVSGLKQTEAVTIVGLVEIPIDYALRFL